jgi:hypothetical protein
MADRPLATLDREYFDAFRAAFEPLKTVLTRSTPREMIAGEVDQEGWVEWRMLPCSQPLEDVFERYARAAGHPLPPSFRRWYSSMHTLDGDCGVSGCRPIPAMRRASRC